ncbi:MAG: hypothetical protein LBL86_02040 [Coriobacteriales bacterium]|jgi:hypothetical protein|nr:hypothetical protein [Coriobacteriales bacterium]
MLAVKSMDRKCAAVVAIGRLTTVALLALLALGVLGCAVPPIVGETYNLRLTLDKVPGQVSDDADLILAAMLDELVSKGYTGDIGLEYLPTTSGEPFKGVDYTEVPITYKGAEGTGWILLAQKTGAGWECKVRAAHVPDTLILGRLTFVGLDDDVPPQEINGSALYEALDGFLEENGLTGDMKLTVLNLVSDETTSEKIYTYTFLARAFLDSDEAGTVVRATGRATNWRCEIVDGSDGDAGPAAESDERR